MCILPAPPIFFSWCSFITFLQIVWELLKSKIKPHQIRIFLNLITASKEFSSTDSNDTNNMNIWLLLQCYYNDTSMQSHIYRVWYSNICSEDHIDDVRIHICHALKFCLKMALKFQPQPVTFLHVQNTACMKKNTQGKNKCNKFIIQINSTRIFITLNK